MCSSQSSWNYNAWRPMDNLSSGSIEDPSSDPVRMARDHWIVRQTKVSDSSEIIDSIDIDMIDASEDIYAAEIYLVVDTNILIHHFSVLKQALAWINADTSRLNVVILIPGIVVSELDYQKNSSKGIANESRRASNWLATEIGNGTSRVKGQAYIQTMLPSGDWRQRNGLSNDELILDCCKYFAHVKRKDVLLCTSDNNLAVQASANATSLFVRGVSGVIRPPSQLWDREQLFECVVPGYSRSIAASAHAPGRSRRTRSEYPATITSPSIFPSQTPCSGDGTEDYGGMEIDTDSSQAVLLQDMRPKDCRDVLHRQMAEDLGQRLRRLAGTAAKLQQFRREHESMYSPSNTKFTGELPTETDWRHAWSLRDCLRFLGKVPPPHRRLWAFEDGEASSLADFLGLPGEKGARPGREWAKHDWRRELSVITRLAKDFGFEDLKESKLVEYEHAVMEAFSRD